MPRRVRPTQFLPWLGAILLVSAALATLGGPGGAPALAETETAQPAGAYSIEVSDVTAKVGAHAVLRATLRPREGYRILKAYNNHVGQLSSLDDGVAFDHKMFSATLVDGALVFEVGLAATKPGKHPINGVFRVGYIQDSADDMAMVSLPLIANVTGTP